MCIIQAYGFLVKGVNVSNPCSANIGDRIEAEIDVTFDPSDVGKTVVASVALITPGVGHEYYTQPFQVSSPGTQTIVLGLTNEIINLNLPGLYKIFGVYIRPAPNTPPICSSNTPTWCDQLTVNAPTHPQVFNICWGTAITPPCSQPPQMPAVPAGTAIKIASDIANSGPNGKVRAVFKANGTQISDQNSTLNTYPGGGLFSPTVNYTMPNANVILEVDAYGWDGTNWVQTDTRSVTISLTAPACSSLSLDPFTANVKVGDKVTFTATTTPSTTPFTVQFRLRDGTVLGQCTTSGGVCQFIWDTTGKAAGTYYVTATVVGQCTSPESAISISVPINQWNVTVHVTDNNTHAPIQGARVTINTQTLQTDASGNVLFKVNEGQISISITKDGYVSVTDTQLIFNNKTLNYPLTPVGPTTGSVNFVSVPSGAEIFLDGVDQGQRTPITLNGIPAGAHSFILKLAGYNNSSGSVTVVGGSTQNVYVALTPITPTTGSLNIVSAPGGAEIFLDGVDQGVTTTTTLTGITPGNHSVKLTMAGYQDFTATVTITAGTTTYLSATLIPLVTTGTLQISSTPEGARVFVDEQDQSLITPATVYSIPAGSHSYKLMLAGYQDATGTFTIQAGATTTVSVTLTPIPVTTGDLQITSTPPGARVYIDGQDTVHETPATIPDLVIGSHTYRLTLAGYNDATGQFTIEAGKIATASVQMTLAQGISALAIIVPVAIIATIGGAIIVSR